MIDWSKQYIKTKVMGENGKWKNNKEEYEKGKGKKRFHVI